MLHVAARTHPLARRRGPLPGQVVREQVQIVLADRSRLSEDYEIGDLQRTALARARSHGEARAPSRRPRMGRDADARRRRRPGEEASGPPSHRGGRVADVRGRPLLHAPHGRAPGARGALAPRAPRPGLHPRREVSSRPCRGCRSGRARAGPPARRRGARWARGTGSSSRSRGPTLLEERDARRVAAVLAAHAELDARAAPRARARPPSRRARRRPPGRARRTDPSAGCPISTYAGRNFPASSRERPIVACVRSLVPKEKNSADRASSPARSAARGSSIIVPNVKGTVVPPCRRPPAATSSTIARMRLELGPRDRQRDHDLGVHLGALARHLRGGLEDRAHLHRVDLGVGDREAAAAVAEHRVELVQVLGALARACCDRDAHRPSRAARAASARSAGTRGAAGRAGGWSPAARASRGRCRRSPRAGTGRSFASAVCAAARRRPRGSSRASPRCAPPRRTCARCGRGRCPRRRSARAVRASSGVSALARTFIVRAASAHDHQLAELAAERRAHGGDRALVDVAGAAVDGDDVALLERDRLGRLARRRRRP